MRDQEQLYLLTWISSARHVRSSTTVLNEHLNILQLA